MILNPQRVPMVLSRFQRRASQYTRLVLFVLIVVLCMYPMLAQLLPKMGIPLDLHVEQFLSMPMAMSSLLLAMGYGLQQLVCKENLLAKGITLCCYTAAVGCLFQNMLLVWSWFTLQDGMPPFLVALPLLIGHILFLTVGYVLWADMFLPKTPYYTLFNIQIPAVFMVGMAFSGILQSVFPSPQFFALLSMGESLVIGLWGLVMILARLNIGLLFKPFFSNLLSIRCYAVTVAVLWLAALGFENIQAGVQIQMLVNHAQVLGLKSLDMHLLAVITLTFPLFFALHLLNLVDSRHHLALSLQETMQQQQWVAAMLSHDLKVPLETEIAALEMLENHPEEYPITPKTQKLLAAINENNRFELDMVCNMLHFFRLGLQAERFEPEEIVLCDLLQSLHAELLPLALRKNQLLTLHLDISHETSLMTDRTGLKRVLHNLLSNAMKHNASGRHIDLRLTREPQGVVFCVSDNGPGLSPEIQNHFCSDMFSAGNGKNCNTGLGLYVARQIITRQGGSIWCDSHPETGTCFSFSLPLAELEDASVQHRPLSTLVPVPSLL